MNFKTVTKNDVTILRLQDARLDNVIAAELKAHLLVMLEQGIKNILIDLDKVEFADSSGLGAILFGIRQARPLNGRVKLVNPQSRVLGLIKIAKLDNVIEAYDDESEAIESFKE
ncbi:MAG: STAS domain-containing protein [candidate division KSB1 bacterium]|nr:STAS domain-containing protein [candidate division KSB1 bacterium]MDZ7366881.1 STAS domain-containing protein [candidate division KSB1 bacterium]MDZ7406050.1 STAS domain-containing protein [candidate division KSB1 bacterium]